MGTYHLIILKKAVKDIQKLDPSVAQMIWRHIEALSENPRSPASKKLKGSQNLYRLRIHDWRVIYEINDSKKVVKVIHVFHRKDAYRDL